MRARLALAAAAMALSLSLSQSASRADEIPELSTIDVNDDNTIDLVEAKAAASAAFDRVNKDGNEVIDRQELKGRLSTEAWKNYLHDQDNSLTRAEYVALVVKAFDRADPDHDGKLDAKELRTPEGQALLRLLK